MNSVKKYKKYLKVSVLKLLAVVMVLALVGCKKNEAKEVSVNLSTKDLVENVTPEVTAEATSVPEVTGFLEITPEPTEETVTPEPTEDEGYDGYDDPVGDLPNELYFEYKYPTWDTTEVGEKARIEMTGNIAWFTPDKASYLGAWTRILVRNLGNNELLYEEVTNCTSGIYIPEYVKDFEVEYFPRYWSEDYNEAECDTIKLTNPKYNSEMKTETDFENIMQELGAMAFPGEPGTTNKKIAKYFPEIYVGPATPYEGNVSGSYYLDSNVRVGIGNLDPDSDDISLNSSLLSFDFTDTSEYDRVYVTRNATIIFASDVYPNMQIYDWELPDWDSRTDSGISHLYFLLFVDEDNLSNSKVVWISSNAYDVINMFSDIDW